jgi:hypothetical protein
LRKGLSEKPPTMNMKLTGDPLPTAYSIKSFTLALILSNSGLKKDVIRTGGRSTLDAPLYFKCKLLS